MRAQAHSCAAVSRAIIRSIDLCRGRNFDWRTKNFMEECGELCNKQGSWLRVACLIIVVQRHDEQKFLEQRTASIFEYTSHGILAPTACRPPPLFRRICSRLKCTRSVDVKSNRTRRSYARSIVTLNRRRIDGRNVVFSFVEIVLFSLAIRSTGQVDTSPVLGTSLVTVTIANHCYDYSTSVLHKHWRGDYVRQVRLWKIIAKSDAGHVSRCYV